MRPMRCARASSQLNRCSTRRLARQATTVIRPAPSAPAIDEGATCCRDAERAAAARTSSPLTPFRRPNALTPAAQSPAICSSTTARQFYRETSHVEGRRGLCVGLVSASITASGKYRLAARGQGRRRRGRRDCDRGLHRGRRRKAVDKTGLIVCGAPSSCRRPGWYSTPLWTGRQEGGEARSACRRRHRPAQLRLIRPTLQFTLAVGLAGHPWGPYHFRSSPWQPSSIPSTRAATRSPR